MKNKLPRGCIWKMQAARRRNKKGKMGRMIMRIRKELVRKEEEEERKGGRERGGIIVGRMKTGKLCWRIAGIYVSGDTEKK